MPSMKELRRRGRKALYDHFFYNVIVVFFVGLLVNGGYNYSTRTVMDNSAVQAAGQAVQTATDKADLKARDILPANRESEIIYDKVKETGEKPADVKNKFTSQAQSAERDLYALGERTSNYEVLENFLREHVTWFREQWTPDTVSEKYTRGVLSVFVNEITDSHSFGFGILNGINKLVFHNWLRESIIIFVMTALSFLYLVFIRNAVIVGQNRYFLERRRYHKTRPDRILFIPRLGYTKHVALVMTEMYFKQLLWTLTIVMGPVKFYEYRMIPYILAENPSVSPKEAFALSKEMMRGEKWHTFLLDLSFIPYVIVGALTFNLSNVFYFSPYRECVNAELYMALRKKLLIKANAMKFISLKAEDREAQEITDAALHILNVFHDRGLDGSSPVEGEYPAANYPFPLKQSRQWLTIDYRKNYSISTYILFFYTFSFFGWIWEVGLHLISDGTFVNRGTLFGP